MITHFTRACTIVPGPKAEMRPVLSLHEAILDGRTHDIPASFNEWGNSNLLMDAARLDVSLEGGGLRLRDTDGFFPLRYAACLVRDHLARIESDLVVTWFYATVPIEACSNEGFGGGIVTVTAEDHDIQDFVHLAAPLARQAANRLEAALIVADYVRENPGVDDIDEVIRVDHVGKVREAMMKKSDEIERLPPLGMLKTLLELGVNRAELEPGAPVPQRFVPFWE